MLHLIYSTDKYSNSYRLFQAPGQLRSFTNYVLRIERLSVSRATGRSGM